MKITLRFIIPLSVFLGLVIFFLMSLGKNPQLLPSALLDHSVPAFELPELHDEDRLITPVDLKGQVLLLNIWATWCAPCREEHPVLLNIARQDVVPLVGLNYKDEDSKARNWLSMLGDPYMLSIVDATGSMGIDLGVYGVPETFIIDANGIIRYKHVGVLTMEIWNEQLYPMVKQLQEQA